MASKQALPRRVEELLSAGRYEEAVSRFPKLKLEILMRQAKELAEILGDAPLWNQQGINCSRAGAYAEAEEAFGRALAERPRFAPAYTNRALLYIQLRRYREAIADFRRSLEIVPGDERVRRMLRDAEAGNWSLFRI